METIGQQSEHFHEKRTTKLKILLLSQLTQKLLFCQKKKGFHTKNAKKLSITTQKQAATLNINRTGGYLHVYK